MLLTNARLVDGTGAPERPADVLVVEGRIEDVQPLSTIDASGHEVVDLDGLVLCPGFIDIHTHYDAQVVWDPDLTPSSWHGVTTALLGNCGFGIAPVRSEDRQTILRTLENVEGMSYEALDAGLPESFETFVDYLDHVDRTPTRLNTMVLIGHTPLRLNVMGTDATEREATAEEVDAMRDALRAALAAGAAGFGTSKMPTHLGAAGKPVPSRLSSADEIAALAGVLGEEGRGIIQAAFGPGMFVEQFAELSTNTGRPVTWTALFAGMGERGRALDLLDRQERLGGSVYPQIACRPLVMQVTLLDPFPFGSVPGFERVLELPRDQRRQLYADPEWRASMRAAVDQDWNKRWPKTYVQETTVHHDLVERAPLSQLAEEAGMHPFDLLCELSLAEDLSTRFRVVLVNDDEDELADLLRDPRTILGLSDAGAHASQLCDACFSTHLLGHWVRDKGVLELPFAVWRLTGQPAELLGLHDRGVVRAGAVADLVAFDPDRVGPGEMERRHDLPAGADRLVALGTGIEHVWVNGVATRTDGVDVAGRRPGRLLRTGGGA